MKQLFDSEIWDKKRGICAVLRALSAVIRCFRDKLPNTGYQMYPCDKMLASKFPLFTLYRY